MNKANVFLLVVVSSLLTYISTATQPAATAAVAQEKWEYGFSHSTFESGAGGGEIFRFSTSLSNSANAWAPEASVQFTKEGIVCQTLSGDPIFYQGSTLRWAKAREDLWRELGDNGWHPYFVIPNKGKTSPTQQYLDNVYWRRRIQ